MLASGGTVLALSASGALDRPAAAPTTAQGTNVGTPQPVTIDESSATINVAAKVSPAVVRITVTGSSDAGDFGVIPETGVGSGVIFNSNGWILTNRHVVQGGETFEVELNDGRVLSGKVYGIDTLTDLAIVKVDATDLPTAAIGESDALKVGQLVIAIGSPLGTYSNSVTSGIVSAKGRTITTDGNSQPLTNLIQTDAAINPGNSGGPLLDANGNVVGINTAIATNSNGIGFAIPIDIARPIMDQAVAGEELARPYLGIQFVSITRQLADEENLPVQAGALVGGRDQNGDPVAGRPAGHAGGRRPGSRTATSSSASRARRSTSGHPLDATLAAVLAGRHGQRRDPAGRRAPDARGHARDPAFGPLGFEGPPGARGGQASASPHRLQRGSPAGGVVRRIGSAGESGSAPTSTNSRERTAVRVSMDSSGQTGPTPGSAGTVVRLASAASQQARISSPLSGCRCRSRPQ